MNGLLLVLFGGLAVAVLFAYLGGRQAGLGRGEQDRGDLAEELTRALGTVRRLEQRVTAQHHRIVAMTAWETVPWPDGRTSPVPVRPEVEPAAAAMPVPRIPRPRRERRTSTAAFLNPGEGVIISGQHLTADDPIDYEQWQDGKPWHTPAAPKPAPERDGWWRDLEDEIWSAKLWLATL